MRSWFADRFQGVRSLDPSWLPTPRLPSRRTWCAYSQEANGRRWSSPSPRHFSSSSRLAMCMASLVAFLPRAISHPSGVSDPACFSCGSPPRWCWRFPCHVQPSESQDLQRLLSSRRRRAHVCCCEDPQQLREESTQADTPEAVQRYRACVSWSAIFNPRAMTSGWTDFRGAGQFGHARAVAVLVKHAQQERRELRHRLEAEARMQPS